MFGDATPFVAALLTIIAYVGLVKYALGFPELEHDIDISVLPETGPTVKAGLYYLLPWSCWCGA